MKIYTKEQVRKLFEQSIKDAGSQSAFAVKHGLRQGRVSDVFLCKRPIGADILAALNLEVIYRRRNSETVKIARKK